MTLEPTQLAIIFACLAAGGILKGATGAGAPVLAVPALAMIFDVRFAVVVMLMPNLLTNLWQAWHFRRHLLPASFVFGFAGAGALGVLLGTLMLAFLSHDVLSLFVAGAVFAYIALRLARPDWKIAYPLASRLSIPAGLAAGLLQGAAGLSAPASITFLSAMRLERPIFIATISFLFVSMTVLQIASLGYLGIFSAHGALISLSALLPILAFMPVGAALAKRLSKESFDRAILILLGFLAAKLVYDTLVG
ncbi:sulfite exporter TauE/SafE family protein [Chelativorans sp. AA-79]|uniref:sulfite exporter TauE/SafE family protein n=1 Tax=Chelativorans sp. AA-79 TaxID=3028735 RepID=UPI0023F68FDA|nr:sulfite exporter TauE/SafE family protein [Chelativorans sp. AA-79]WEX10396.1 sulfite exporter TauE/SafE family protein [Chelativorans sp. AA-79]